MGKIGERRVGEGRGQHRAGRGHPPSTEDDSRLDALGEEQDQRLNLRIPQDRLFYTVNVYSSHGGLRSA